MPWAFFDWNPDELPEPPRPKRKACRRSVTARLREIAAAQTYPIPADTETEMAALAGQCANCARCPKFAAGIAFMLLRPKQARSRLQR